MEVLSSIFDPGRKMTKIYITMIFLLSIFNCYNSQVVPFSQHLKRSYEEDIMHRLLQTTCLSTQYLNGSTCVNCNAACSSCLPPSGSCERCVYTLPNVIYTQVNQNSTNGSSAICAANSQNCIYRDPFCMGDCGSNINGQRCQSCLKGTSVSLVYDTIGNANVYTCLACNIQYCVNCFWNANSSMQQCIECERQFTLVTDNSTGNPITRCVRTAGYCPPNCVCDFGGTMNCTKCNDTSMIMVKETGISDFYRCQRNNSVNANLDCGPNCNICNTLTGVCLQCSGGLQPFYDNSLTFPVGKYVCQPPCGTGCLSCNTATRSCAQCDQANNYTLYLRDQNTKTYLCQDITNMCDPACVNCDLRGLQLYPPVLVGSCIACRSGYYVTGAKTCQQCPNLCSSCAAVTGSCSACQNIQQTLYQDTTLNINLCTDLTCSSACISCDIPGGMNSGNKRPNCMKCIQGYYMTSAYDCLLCPLNCGSCDDITGKCNKCKPGFSLYNSGGVIQCISDSTVGVCQVSHCSTCNATSNTTCVICDPGYVVNGLSNCDCYITLAFMGQYFTSDWQSIMVTWNGLIQAYNWISTASPSLFCSGILSSATLTALGQSTNFHRCFLTYDITKKQTTLQILLNPSWPIPVDATVNRVPTIQISMNTAALMTPECLTAMDSAQFTAIPLTGGDPSNPVVTISTTFSQVPFCTSSVRLSSGLSSGLFNRPATYSWQLVNFQPTESTNTKQTALMNLLNADLTQSDDIIDAPTISLLVGKTIDLRLTVTNFLGKTGQALVELVFLNQEGIFLMDVMETYIINPQNDFQLQPRVGISNCNFTAVSIIRQQRMQVQCTVQLRNPITTAYSNVSIVDGCLIPSGMMNFGSQYRIQFIAYDPAQEYLINATKFSLITLVKPPIIARIIGGDQTIDSNKPLTLSVRGENLSRDLSFSWSCKDPTTGLQCVDLYGNYLFLQGTESILIRANILALGAKYRILFTAADQLDVSRIATDYVIISTLPPNKVLIQVGIYSDATSNNNQINVFEKQRFVAVILNNASNPIRDVSKYTFTWSVTDSMGNAFTSFQANMTVMTIMQNMLQQGNFYTVCISVIFSIQQLSGQACTKYTAYGDSNMFSFNVNPKVGNAFSTPFTFTASNLVTLNKQYSYEFGYLAYVLNQANAIIDYTFIPFDATSTISTRQFKVQNAQPGQSNMVRVYSKITSQTGERYIYFQDLSVTLPVQNATWVGATINMVDYTSLNEVFTKVTQYALVASTMDVRYKQIVIRTLVSAIANITNQTIAQETIALRSRMLMATQPTDASATQVDRLRQRLTIARSLSKITDLISDDPMIIGQKEKDQLKATLTTLMDLDTTDTQLYASFDNGPEFSQIAFKTNNPITQNSQNSIKNKNVSTDPNQTPLLSDSAMVKDQGTINYKLVEKLDLDTSNEMMRICDDLFHAESTSNLTDPELQRMSLICMKKVASGAINEITNSYTYTSAYVRLSSYVFVTGKDVSAGKTNIFVDPLYGFPINVTMPQIDLCNGVTCQMNILIFKDSPISKLISKVVGSSVSISFEASIPKDQNSLLVQQLKVQNLQSPVNIRMILNQKNLNQTAKQRCVYYDVAQNRMSDSGIITQFDLKTGNIVCYSSHLTDFTVEEYDPSVNTTTQPPNMNRVDVFVPLSIGKTTPSSIMIVLAIALGALIMQFQSLILKFRFSFILDKVGYKNLDEQHHSLEKVQTLTDIMYFNKYQERQKYEQVQKTEAELAQQVDIDHPDGIHPDDSSHPLYPDDEDDEEDIRAWKAKKRRELKIEEELKRKLARARGQYPLIKMLILAFFYQHRVIQLIFVFDQGLSRLSRSFIFITSMFINLAITGFYCTSNSTGMTAVITIAIQKVFLMLINTLMVKRPKRKLVKNNDEDFQLKRTPERNTLNGGNQSAPKQKEITTYKLEPCDKVSIAIGYFLIFAVIGGTLFYSLMMSQQIKQDANTQWAGSFILVIFLDLVLFECVAVIISTILLKKVGVSPVAMGRFRNFILKFGPRAIKTAVINQETNKPAKKQKKEPAKETAAPQKKKLTPEELAEKKAKRALQKQRKLEEQRRQEEEEARQQQQQLQEYGQEQYDYGNEYGQEVPPPSNKNNKNEVLEIQEIPQID